MSTKKKKLSKQFEVRPIRFDDVTAYKDALNASANHLEKYLDWGQRATSYNFNQCKYVVERSIKDSYPNRSYAICYKGKLVGEACFGEGSRPDGLQITYWISKRYAGQGLCTKAVQRLIEFSWRLPDINFLEIHADKNNLASIRVARKAGFIHYDSYEYSTKGTEGAGVMDVFIYLTPRARLIETVSKLQWKQGLDLNIRPNNWHRKEALNLINTGSIYPS